MKMLLLITCLNVLFASHTFGDERVTKIVFRTENPGVALNAAATEPRTLYRMGTTMGRIEQPVVAPQKGTSLFIVSGKDGWVIDLTNHTGEHMIDSGSDHSFYAPIIPSPEPNQPAPVRAFEMGHELAFMQGQSVQPKAVVKGGKKLSLYECTRDDYTLKLYLAADTSTPVETDVLKDGKLLTRIDYLEYKTLPFDPSLFEPPADVKISEANS